MQFQDVLLKKKGKGAINRTWHKTLCSLVIDEDVNPPLYRIEYGENASKHFNIEASTEVTTLPAEVSAGVTNIFKLTVLSTGKSIELAAEEGSVTTKWLNALELLLTSEKTVNYYGFIDKRISGIVPRFHRRLFISTDKELTWFIPPFNTNEAEILEELRTNPSYYQRILDMAGYTCHAVLPWRSIELFAKDSGSRIFTIQSERRQYELRADDLMEATRLKSLFVSAQQAAAREYRREQQAKQAAAAAGVAHTVKSDFGTSLNRPGSEQYLNRMSSFTSNPYKDQGGRASGRNLARPPSGTFDPVAGLSPNGRETFVRTPSGIATNSDLETAGGGSSGGGSGRVLKKSHSMMNPAMHRPMSAQNILKAKKGRPGGGSLNHQSMRGSANLSGGGMPAQPPPPPLGGAPGAAPDGGESTKQRQRRLSGAGMDMLRSGIPEFADSSGGAMPEL